MCTCPAVSNCYHILAAKLSMGIPIENKKTKVNMTRVAANKRKRVDKKIGNKKTRKTGS